MSATISYLEIYTALQVQIQQICSPEGSPTNSSNHPRYDFVDHPGYTYLHQWPTWHQEPISHLHPVAAIANEFVPDQGMPPNTGLHRIIPLTKYSLLRRLLSVTTYINRFIQTLRNKTQASKGPLAAVELDTARVQWIHSCQHKVY